MLADNHYYQEFLHMDVMRPQTQMQPPIMRQPPFQMPPVSDETLSFEVADKDEPLIGHEEVFSYAPHVEGSGYQNQPSYEEAPTLTKHDMSRYAIAYK